MIKDVAALLDGRAGDEVALAHAARIARVFEANLTALYLNILPEIVTSGEGGISPIAIDMVITRAKDLGAASATRLAARVKDLAVPGTFRHVDALSSDVWDLVASASRPVDLIVAMHPNAHAVRREWRHVAEAALLTSARSVYFADRAVEATQRIRSVLVAWDGSRSATRALTEAVPFLQRAQQALIVTVECVKPTLGKLLPGDELVSHLARLGVTASYRCVKSLDHSVSQVLEREIAGAEADLLVMGAYGHSPLRERILGGVTRDFLKSSPVPLLMAH